MVPIFLRGGEGNDRLFADGNDTVEGGAGRDVLYVDDDNGITVDLGTTSIEVVRSGEGDDLFTYSEGNDENLNVRAGGGDDVVHGGAGRYTIHGNAGDDIILGGAGRDYLRGGAGDDTVTGGAGDDRIFGEAGSDTLTGGEGSDRFFCGSLLEGGDTITDFETGKDRFVFDEDAFGDAVDADGNIAFTVVDAEYDGTNEMGQAGFVYELNEDGGGTLYYDSDPEDPGYTTIAQTEGDIGATDIAVA